MWSSNHIGNWDSLPMLKNFWVTMLCWTTGWYEWSKLKRLSDSIILSFLDKYYLMWLSFWLNRLINGLALFSLFLAIFFIFFILVLLLTIISDFTNWSNRNSSHELLINESYGKHLHACLNLSCFELK